MSHGYSIQHIALNILKCCVIFYATYFACGSLLFGMYRLPSFDGKIPFNFNSWTDLTSCCMNYSAEQVVNVVAMEITYTVASLLFGSFILNRVWDYAITVTLIHIGMSCLVMMDFARCWSWWVCLGVGLVIMISLGEAVSYGRRKCRQNVKVEPNSRISEPTNYLQVH